MMKMSSITTTKAIILLLLSFSCFLSVAESLSKIPQQQQQHLFLPNLTYQSNNNNNNKRHSYNAVVTASSSPIPIIRGGAAARTSPSSSSPSISSVGHASAQLVKSIWEYSSHVVSNRIVPIVKNPNQRIVIPLKKTVKATNDALRESFSTFSSSEEEDKNSIKITTKIETGTTSATSAAKVEETQSANPTAPNKPSVARITKRQKRKTRLGRNHKDITATVENNTSHPPPTLSILLLPHRLFKIGFTSWILCEVLDHVGILTEETPLILKSQVDRVWHGNVRPTLSTWTIKLLDWWKTAKESSEYTIRNVWISIPVKYEFAVGATIGMVLASPILSVLTMSTVFLRPAVVLYGLAELNAYNKSRGNHRWTLAAILNLGPIKAIGVQMERILEALRGSVHNVFSEPDDSTTRHLLTYPNGGTMNSLVSFHKDGRENDETRYSLGPTAVATAASTTKAREEVEYSVTAQRLPRFGMIRHGIFVGGLIGALAGV